ncbi:hypothetical protein [Streptomyces sp. I05A-00742]|uniref:hypothetical protein n=1 Tax=Streptomyces sp. I05A-00742 TaxID=2732853 RepID=UPI001488583D|nr:hypothetical protein [Streptomyces sp. I05A-00742]
MIELILHRFRLVEAGRDAMGHRMLDEARAAAGRERGGQEAEGRVRGEGNLPLVPRQRRRRVSERAGL